MEKRKSPLERENRRLKSRLHRYVKALRGVLCGFTVHELEGETRKAKGTLDHLFMLPVFRDLSGLPLLLPYYSMRLLPHILPYIEMRKRSILRERDLTHVVDLDLWPEVFAGEAKTG